MTRTDQSQLRKKWTKGDIERLKRIYPDRDDEQVAEELGRTLFGVRVAALVLGLKKSKRHPRNIRKI